MIFYEDHMLNIEFPKTGLIPGYVIVNLKGEVYSLADLNDQAQSHLMAVMKKLHEFLNDSVQPERIYTLSIGEVQPRLHFHIFPRTAALLQDYRIDNNITQDNISGLLLFEWARSKYASHAFGDVEAINSKLKLHFSVKNQSIMD